MSENSEIVEAAEQIALALDGLAESIDRLADKQQEGFSVIAAALDDVATVIEGRLEKGVWKG